MKKLIVILGALASIVSPLIAQTTEGDIAFTRIDNTGVARKKYLPADSALFLTGLGVSGTPVTLEGDNTFTGSNEFYPGAGKLFLISDVNTGVSIGSSGVISGPGGIFDVTAGTLMLGIKTFASLFDGTDGNVLTSVNATNDADGNLISTTYAAIGGANVFTGTNEFSNLTLGTLNNAPVGDLTLSGDFSFLASDGASPMAQYGIDLASGLNTAGSSLVIEQATTTQRGTLATATGADVLAGTSSTIAVTPEALVLAGYRPNPEPYMVIASGTAYTLTGSFANAVFGTTSPVTPALATGGYLVTVDVSSALVGATTVAGQAVNIILRRTNNTPANIGTQRQQPLPLVTLLTGAGPSVSIAQFPYTANAGDILTVQASLTGTLGAGSVTINAAHIVAVPR